VAVKNLMSSERYVVREHVAGDRVVLVQRREGGDEVRRSCVYSRASGFGHKVRGEGEEGGTKYDDDNDRGDNVVALKGVRCVPTVNLPTNCFCAGDKKRNNGGGGAYLPLSDVLRAVASFGGNYSLHQVRKAKSAPGGKPRGLSWEGSPYSKEIPRILLQKRKRRREVPPKGGICILSNARGRGRGKGLLEEMERKGEASHELAPGGGFSFTAVNYRCAVVGVFRRRASGGWRNGAWTGPT